MDKDGRLLLGNTVTAERMKTDMESLKKGSLYDYLPPEVANSRRKYIQQVIETGKPLRFEDERFGKTILNSIYPVLGPDGQVSHFAVFGTDIMEGKKSRQIIEESKSKLDQANAML
jgi:two-component system, sensor histidine kinase